jgi:hypothetical protein
VIETSLINRTHLSRPEDRRRAIFRNVVDFRFLYIFTFYILFTLKTMDKVQKASGSQCAVLGHHILQNDVDFTQAQQSQAPCSPMFSSSCTWPLLFPYTDSFRSVYPDHKLYSAGNCPLLHLQNFCQNVWYTTVTKLLLTKCLVTNKHCQTDQCSILHCIQGYRAQAHCNPHSFLPLLSPTQCCQFKTSFPWTTQDALYAQMSVRKYGGSTKICSIFINNTICQ